MAAEDIRQTDETLAWLPMAWFGDALASQASHCRSVSPATVRSIRKPRAAICARSARPS